MAVMPTSSERSCAPGNVVVIGAGPAGLTAAYALARRGAKATVVEADAVVGGISRTVERDGWRFDIGGHRFFTKVPEVSQLWHEILGPDDLLVRPRLSRIYHNGAFIDYPIRLGNALKALGPTEALLCGLSYLWVRVRRPADQDTFEGWTAARFGWRLYRTFFKTYTEKVWGIPAREIRADWAAQRIRNLSFFEAVRNAVAPVPSGRVTSLIERFEYPRLGPGMMWERTRDLVLEAGSEVRLSTRATRLRRDASGATSIEIEAGGRCEELPVDHVISSMPLAELATILDPSAPPEVEIAAKGLRFRDFLTVALVVPAERGFPDNWVYVHDRVRLGRVQNFGSWSPEMVKDGWTCLGLEYFVFEGDELWTMADDELIAFAAGELEQIGLARPGDVAAGYVVRMPKAYPVYDVGYEKRVETVRRFLADELPNVHPVGRNGMHRYNNQDHSMLTALLTVENLFGGDYDTWAVNVDSEYHEEQLGRLKGSGGGGTGRAAPVVPTRA